ncbi:MAG: prenyltransferase/squalene oxidase repeat-containing protein [Planctomycetota bacterium]
MNACPIRTILAVVLAAAGLATVVHSSQEAPDPAAIPVDEAVESAAASEGDLATVADGDGTTPSPESGAENRPAADEMTEAQRSAIARGLDHLASLQNADGSFGRGRYADNAGIVALCGIALLADGHMPGRGRHGETVRRSLDYLLDHVTETGLIAAETGHGPMYGHGFATLFLGEVYGMTSEDARVRDALERAVELIVNSQNDEGGWRYNPVPYDADVSVTICQVMALRSARDAGIKVPASTIERAVEYVKKCQNPDGGFKYMIAAGGSGWARSAAGVATLFYAGRYGDESIARGLDYLERQAFPSGRSSLTQAHYFYGHYYAVQAMYLAGGDWWRRWWPAIRDDLVAQQTPAGGWLDQQQGGAYATAMALIILQMPQRYLPIFQR